MRTYFLIMGMLGLFFAGFILGYDSTKGCVGIGGTIFSIVIILTGAYIGDEE